MTTWNVSSGEILDSTADVLICSANPLLNLSGGVGGAFQMRYGTAMQDFLHTWLKDHRLRFVAPGNIVVAPSCGSPFRAIIHAVAIDAFYDTTADFIHGAYAQAFAAIAEMECRRVASACLACGYGRASPQLFASAVREFIHSDLAGIASVEFISTNLDIVAALRQEIASGSASYPTT